jgi:hypothetical protein
MILRACSVTLHLHQILKFCFLFRNPAFQRSPKRSGQLLFSGLHADKWTPLVRPSSPKNFSQIPKSAEEGVGRLEEFMVVGSFLGSSGRSEEVGATGACVGEVGARGGRARRRVEVGELGGRTPENF